MILTTEEWKRITHTENWYEITVDLHQLTAKKAQKLLNNIIVLNRNDCKLRLIHGYHRGTVIKDMIWNNFRNSRIEEKKPVKGNPGQTILRLRGVA